MWVTGPDGELKDAGQAVVEQVSLGRKERFLAALLQPAALLLLPWTRSGRPAPQTELSGTSPSPAASSRAPAPPDRWYLSRQVQAESPVPTRPAGGGVHLTDGLLQGLKGDLLRQLGLQTNRRRR